MNATLQEPGTTTCWVNASLNALLLSDRLVSLVREELVEAPPAPGFARVTTLIRDALRGALAPGRPEPGLFAQIETLLRSSRSPPSTGGNPIVAMWFIAGAVLSTLSETAVFCASGVPRVVKSLRLSDERTYQCVVDVDRPAFGDEPNHPPVAILLHLRNARRPPLDTFVCADGTTYTLETGCRVRDNHVMTACRVGGTHARPPCKARLSYQLHDPATGEFLPDARVGLADLGFGIYLKDDPHFLRRPPG